MAIELFFLEVSRSRLLVDVLHSVGFPVSYSEVLKFNKCAAVSSECSVTLLVIVSWSQKIDFGNS